MTPPTDIPSLNTMSLKKGDTFHSPTRLSSELCNLSIANSPKRSYTSPQSLEDLIAGEQRVADVIDRVNKTLSGFSSVSSGANLLKDPEVLPVPSFMLDRTSLPSTDVDDAKTLKRRTRQANHSHASDSGIGSSIGGSSLYSASIASSVNTSAVTKSHAALSSSNGHVLSPHAVKHIQLHIVDPILKDESLKEFHPLVRDVPSRIGAKAITNLRDLEKTLIFLAPVSSNIQCGVSGVMAHGVSCFKEYSPCSVSYQQFCETTVHCIRETAPGLSEADQRLPADRPYTNGYFLDLVEQIRKYAAIMAATREKEAKGEALDDMDFSPYVFQLLTTTIDTCRSLVILRIVHLLWLYRNEKITLKGGMAQDGSPLELVREKDGKIIHLATDEERAAASSKRSVSEESDDEFATRSMARRRKSEKPGDVVHVCRDCGKDFKRPCDLTKHEKTHSRPWKCPEVGCKYHEYGWPTEKEMDRHVNDKHSAAPSLYKCKYHPCSYSSKRESNCKQHMEKAHGWNYIRSKSNGRRKAGGQQLQTDMSPAAPTLSTPMTPYAPSPVFPSYSSHGASHENLSITNENLFAGNGFYNAEDHFDFNNLDVNLTGAANGPFGHTPAMSAVDERRASHTISDPMLSSNPSPTEPSAFADAFTPEQPELNINTEFNDPAFLFSDAQFQQPTPATSTGPSEFNLNLNLNATNVFGTGSTQPQHVSPLSGRDLPLYSPADAMQIDGGLGDNLAFQAPHGNFSAPQSDFELYPPTTGVSNSLDDMFPDLPRNTTAGASYDWNNFNQGADAFNDAFGYGGQQ
ncbi:MAG: copper-binding transcription factor [Bogoriella megaspora]|nr:MAG: copper-binding transcription factor [Bogoriella megaspora]